MTSEFEFIERIGSKYSLDKIGDDCAVLPKDANTDLLLTIDMLVEDIDFRLAWTTPQFLGHKALAVSLSDIAAMGGNPVWAMLSFGVSKNVWTTDFIDRFYEGWFMLANKFRVELVGGDVSRSPDRLVIDSIVGGEIGKGGAILRSTAKAGDAIFVSRTLGAAAGGLKLLENGSRFTDNMVDSKRNLIVKQLQPQPETALAKILYSLAITTSMIDVSDGLSSDLSHLCRMSGVGADLYAERIPIDDDLYPHFPSNECMEMALNGGEDFVLLFTVAEKNISDLDSLNVTHIGEITAKPGVLQLVDVDKTAILPPNGYRHF